jgi:CheY-like chemotaxis protein
MRAQALLSKMGLAVSVASKGEECLKSMGETGFDVVIMAAEMPEPMSGWQCEAEIRRRESIMFPHDPKVPIVAVVSAKTKDDPKLAETFSAVFSKPFDRNKITAAVNELLKGPATGAADPPAAAVASATAAKDSPKLQPIAAAEKRGEESSAGAFGAAAADPFRAPSSNKLPPASQSPIPLQGRRTRILVVEDHWANRKMLESMLNQQVTKLARV